jgi:hypothetical protein
MTLILCLQIYASGGCVSQSLCLCDCGNRKEIANPSLIKGSTTSCGCYHSDVMRLRAIHGYNRVGKRHPIYDVWNAMLRRCQNSNHQSYSYYGARGITVCERWQKFSNFIDEMLPGYRRGLCIERIDNNKGYFKENCKWATRREQMLNRRTARLLAFRGETLNLSIWAERSGIPFHVLHQRLDTLGWSVKRTLTMPYKPRFQI